MSPRAFLRTAVLSASVPLVAVLASPAAAVNRDDGDDPGPGLSVLQTIGIYVCIPLAIFLVCALFVYAPPSARSPRYRPGLGWWAEPVWFGPRSAGPAQGTAPPPGQETAAGADTRVGVPAHGIPTAIAGGGASARW